LAGSIYASLSSSVSTLVSVWEGTITRLVKIDKAAR
jgi:hypothetical protein